MGYFEPTSKGKPERKRKFEALNANIATLIPVEFTGLWRRRVYKRLSRALKAQHSGTHPPKIWELPKIGDHNIAP